MERFNKYRLIFLLMVFGVGVSYGQQREITGRVISTEDNLPLPGVTVVVKGTLEGTSTGSEGNFTLSVSPDAGTLVFSFIGFLPKEVDIAGRSVVQVSLSPSVVQLNEVVAIGYGTLKKSDHTGAITSVSNDVLVEQPSARIEHALQGRAPGVIVQRGGGNVARDDMKIRIRGTNSITGDNQPLIVVDGFLGGSLGEINPQDVESMEVLSDASATAIYGSRGSNGVIIVTTKKGRAGKTKITYNGNVGWDNVYNKVDLYQPVEYMELINQIALEETGVGNQWFSNEEIDEYRNGTRKGTDWQDVVFRTGLKQEHQVSFSGGNDKNKFFNSVGYSDVSGIVDNDEYQRFTFRSNLENKITDFLTSSLNVNFVRKKGSQGYYYGNRMSDVLIFSPNLPVIDPETGDYQLSGNYGASTAENPVQTIEITDNLSINNKFQANLGLDFNLFKGLKYRLFIASVINNNTGRGFKRNTASESIERSSVSNSSNTSYSWQINNQLSYILESGAHSLNATLVQEAAKSETLNANAGNTTLITTSLGYYNIGVGSTPSVGSGYVGNQLASFLGRANYTFKEKYLLSLSMRADGSSKFTPGNKWAYYPSGAFAWQVHKEPFFSSLSDFIDVFKIRASYGEVGSQAIQSYQTLSNMEIKTTSVDASSLSNAVSLGAPPSPDLKWETTSQTNLGFNSTFANGRITFDFDYYFKRTTDLLYNVPLPFYSGVPRDSWNSPAYKLDNVGEMKNQGVALDLKGVVVSTKDFYFKIGANLSYNKNEFVGFTGELAKEESLSLVNNQAGSSMNGITNFYLTPGRPLGDIHGLTYLGTWKTSEAAEAAKYNYLPGDPKFLDVNEDFKYDDSDAGIIGNGQPEYNVGLSLDLTYKNFDLAALFQGSMGFEILNIDKFNTQRFYTSTRMDNRFIANVNESDIWSYNRGFISAASSDYVEKGDYIRLNNLSLGYTLPHDVTERVGISSCRLYINGQNLFTITKFTGLDPSVTSTGDSDLQQGVALGTYPIPRTISLGVNLTF